MIIFKLTFLLAFNTESEEFKQKKRKANEEKKQTDTDNESKQEYELEIGEFITSLRIEYELFPKKFKYNIDLTCWNNVAKISISDGFRYYGTLKSGNILWIPITIQHFFKGITEDELVNLHSHIITFNINTTKKDNITSKGSFLYCWESEATSEKFVEYFEADPNKRGNHIEKFDETKEFLQMSKKCETSDSVISWLRFTGKTHCHVVYETILSVKKGNEIKCKQFIPQSEMPTETKAVRKSKSKNHEVKKKDPYFIIPGEVFFTDPTLAVYKLKEANKFLSLGFVLVSVENLMTREQKAILNPFIVKINKLECISVELLKQHGYKEIFISYDIPFLAKYDSSTKPIGRTIYFNESHAHFTKDVPRYKYLEFLRSERVKVHIKGVREEDKELQPALFGTKKRDRDFSRRLQPREAFEFLRKKEKLSKIQTLAIANYDISSLLRDVWYFREQSPCYHPDNLLHGITENNSIRLVDIITVAEVNLADIDRQKSFSPLLDGFLASELTTLDMEFYFLAPQFANQHLRNIQNSFKRFFLTFYDSILAQRLLASILQHNANLIGLNAVLMDPVNFTEDKVKIDIRKRHLSKQQQASDESMQEKLKGMIHPINDVITGFMIENGSETHIFVEGISHGYILEVWNKIHKINTSVAKVFLNSETEFEKRLYEDFMVAGIFPVILKKPLQMIFQEQDTYIQGMIPVPCFKALHKLNTLLRTETLREMLKQDLFPSSNELVSLNIEYGVPLKIKK